MNSKKISSVIKGWLFIGFGTLIIVIFCFYPMIGALANSDVYKRQIRLRWLMKRMWKAASI